MTDIRFEHNVIDAIPEGWERCDATSSSAPCVDGREHRTFKWTLGTSDVAPHGSFEIHKWRPPKPLPSATIGQIIKMFQAQVDAACADELDTVVDTDYLRRLLEHVQTMHTALGGAFVAGFSQGKMHDPSTPSEVIEQIRDFWLRDQLMRQSG